MDNIMDKILAIILRGFEAQATCGIQAMQMQAIKGRIPNWQAQQFMGNNNQALLGFGLQAPNLLNGTVPQQGNSELAQLVELAKAKDSKADDKVSRLDKKVYHMGNDIKAIAESVGKLADAAKK